MRWIYWFLGGLIIVNVIAIGKMFGSRVRLKEHEKNRIKKAEEEITRLETENRQLFDKAQELGRAVQDYSDNVRSWMNQIQKETEEINQRVQKLLELNRRMSKQLCLAETLCGSGETDEPSMQKALEELRQLLVEDNQMLKDWEDAQLHRGNYAQQSMPIEELFESNWEMEP